MSGPATPELVGAMLNPELYPHRPDAVELRETHISWVFVAGKRAYKVKKPVTLPFLDFGTLERRRFMCHEEVRLNQRLAPQIYQGVVAIVPRGDGYGIAPEGDPTAIEYAVEMQHVDETRSLAALAACGALGSVEIDRVARLIARFHEGAMPAAPEHRRLEPLHETLAENIATLRKHCGAMLGPERLGEAEHYTRRFIEARASELVARGRRGMVRDCHGDLRAEHVIVPVEDDPYIYDCVEFSSALREIDVVADLAFLVMDLARLGEEALGARLLAQYRLAGGDPGDDRLVAFFASYRAWVRAKVACLRLAELTEEASARRPVEDDVSDLFALGERFAWRSRRPLVLVICGVARSGKSTLAEALSHRSGLRHLQSDVVRKRLAGIEPTERAAKRHYTPEFTRRTYRELGTVARAEFERSGGALIDATFHRRSERDAFCEGFQGVESAIFVHCRAPRELLVRRARSRAEDPDSVSDATEEVVKQQLLAWEPLDELAPEDQTEIATQLTVAAQIAAVERAVDDRVFGLEAGEQ